MKNIAHKTPYLQRYVDEDSGCIMLRRCESNKLSDTNNGKRIKITPLWRIILFLYREYGDL